jgi:hypothetical protein
MYKIIGADGKEYGPVSVERLGEWVAHGRINAQTRVQAAGSSDWIPAAEVPALAALFGPPGSRPAGQGAPPVLTAPTTKVPSKGLAIVSFVLGLCSFVLCLSVFAGIPAIICGHIARSRAVRSPLRYGGAGLAKAGLILGYLSIIVALIIPAFLLPAFAKRRSSAPRFDSCQNNLRQIGLAFKVWALEHKDQYPFNVSTNSGGSLELCATGGDGFDNNAVAHFSIISNELTFPSFLVCPNDPAHRSAQDFATIQSANVSYRLRTGTNINGDNPQEILAICPIHGNQLFCDGNVRKAPPPTPGSASPK